MTIDLLSVAAGLAILLVGAWLLVRSASQLAAALGLSPVVVGATIVAFGTSAPEFVVSVLAGVRGVDGIAVGAVLGSNVMNTAAVVGLAAAISPLVVHPRLLRWELPVLAMATLVVIALCADGSLSRVEGAALFACLLGFVVTSLRRRDGGGSRLHGAPLGFVARNALLAVVGVAALAAGSEAIVRGAESLATAAGLGEVVIGATVVAVGTSLPEIVTTVVAAIRKQADIAIANIVGSNIFNLLGVLGLTAAVTPLAVAPALYSFELPALAVATATLGAFAWRGRDVNRMEGILLLAFYGVFLTVVLIRGV